nr:hypothetical protein CTI12_AA190870 [Tanacetum cinerariifolium]
MCESIKVWNISHCYKNECQTSSGTKTTFFRKKVNTTALSKPSSHNTNVYQVHSSPSVNALMQKDSRGLNLKTAGSNTFTEGGLDRKIKLDRNSGIDELYIKGYFQAMLNTMYKHEYLRVRVIDDQVVLKNLPPNSVLIDEIMDLVKGFLTSKGLLKGETSSTYTLVPEVQEA